MSGINLRRHSLKCLRKYPHLVQNIDRNQIIRGMVGTGEITDDNANEPLWHMPQERNSVKRPTMRKNNCFKAKL